MEKCSEFLNTAETLTIPMAARWTGSWVRREMKNRWVAGRKAGWMD